MNFTTFLNVTSMTLSAAGWAILIIRWSQPGMPRETYGFWALASTGYCIYGVLNGSTGWAAFHGTLAAYWAWMWWRGRNKGRMKKALKELGAKSRARVEAMVERLSQSPAPAPVGAR